MDQIRDRSIRHDNKEDVEQMYASDIYALKKLQIVESNRKKNNSSLVNAEKTDENFAGKKNQRKVLKKPTASENRSIQKLFRRKITKEEPIGGPNVQVGDGGSNREDSLNKDIARVSKMRQ